MAAEVRNMQEGFCLGAAIQVDYRLRDAPSRDPSFVTATTAPKSYKTAPLPRKDDSNIEPTSEWKQYLERQNLIPGPMDELDWSGRGQHIEYAPSEEADIPLFDAKELGSGAYSVVESVRCRRIRLARKTITCRNFLRRVDAIKEVEHLQRLQHTHLLRVVGTYTLRRELSILLYPVADYSLDTFLASLCLEIYSTSDIRSIMLRRLSLLTFFGCLASTLHYIHSNATKHMDIKPQNILVKKRTDLDLLHPLYKVYIADFGIARRYQNIADAETSTPTCFTRAYAAPEVVNYEPRGLPADIFSMGCVFAEILYTMENWDQVSPTKLRQNLLQFGKSPRGERSYAAITEQVQDWLKHLHEYKTEDEEAGIIHLTIRMLCCEPSCRPSAEELAERITTNGSQIHPDRYCCSLCPDSFEGDENDAAEDQFTTQLTRTLQAATVDTQYSVGKPKSREGDKLWDRVFRRGHLLSRTIR
jgi:serine/threonine protein kinase